MMFVVSVHRLSPFAQIPATVAIVMHVRVYFSHIWSTCNCSYTSTLFAISCALLFAILLALSRVENSSSARFFSYSRCSLSVDLYQHRKYSYLTFCLFSDINQKLCIDSWSLSSLLRFYHILREQTYPIIVAFLSSVILRTFFSSSMPWIFFLLICPNCGDCSAVSISDSLLTNCVLQNI